LANPEFGSDQSKPHKEGVDEKCCIFYKKKDFVDDKEPISICHDDKKTTKVIDAKRSTFGFK